MNFARNGAKEQKWIGDSSVGGDILFLRDIRGNYQIGTRCQEGYNQPCKKKHFGMQKHFLQGRSYIIQLTKSKKLNLSGARAPILHNRTEKPHGVLSAFNCAVG